MDGRRSRLRDAVDRVHGVSGVRRRRRLACARLRTLGQGDLPGAYVVRVGAHEALHLPGELDDDAGALAEPIAVAVHALRAAAIRAGDDVLVLGGGPIGLAVATCARHAGAAEVVVVDRLPARRALAARFGASAAVDPPTTPRSPRRVEAGRGAGRGDRKSVSVPGMLGESLQQCGAATSSSSARAWRPTCSPAMACLRSSCAS
jgi:threonine dehydrogenase-like Zn-dependent dehydrogenase